jgi:hypothetical protein
MKKLLLVAILLLLSLPVQAACRKDWHVPGTSGNAELCKKRYEFELKKQQDKLVAEQKAYEQALVEANKPAVRNEGTQTGNTGTILNLGGALGGDNNGATGPAAGGDFAMPAHNIAIEWSGYHFSQSLQVGRTMPDPVLMPTGFRYEWYFSKRFGFGVLYQQFMLKANKSFDPITVERDITESVTITNDQGEEEEATREVKRNVPLYFPGSVSRFEYQRLMYFITFNMGFGADVPDWNLALRFGSGMANTKVVYDQIDMSLESNEYATQPTDKEYSSSRPVFLDVGIQKWFQQTRVELGVRFVEADSDSANYLDFIRGGGTEIMLSATFGLPSFGFVD